AVIKTQGSDTKLVGQMQPFYEAKGLSRLELAGSQIPPLVTQIADGENGGVMMNEFPAKYFEVIRECSGSPTPIMNVTEYLERLLAKGIHSDEFWYRNALFHLLTAETSCYRYWGEGIWTAYGTELSRRTIDIASYVQ